jgi:hypothetical protein
LVLIVLLANSLRRFPLAQAFFESAALRPAQALPEQWVLFQASRIQAKYWVAELKGLKARPD